MTTAGKDESRVALLNATEEALAVFLGPQVRLPANLTEVEEKEEGPSEAEKIVGLIFFGIVLLVVLGCCVCCAMCCCFMNKGVPEKYQGSALSQIQTLEDRGYLPRLQDSGRTPSQRQPQRSKQQSGDLRSSSASSSNVGAQAGAGLVPEGSSMWKSSTPLPPPLLRRT